ncbi:hypothetical protein ACFYZ8_08015 [Streptomyces sp. NPDC001668]|uniref:hypothetical protein n=1 Tax=unclassified Streptomyces TaxID=2593676 RepID=UPI0036B1C24B
MSNDLLDGTRAVIGRLELVREPVDMRSVAEGACADIRGLFAHEHHPRRTAARRGPRRGRRPAGGSRRC